jgi:predicted secreted protein
MTMTQPVRKLTLTAHVTASIGWIGALAVFFAHALAGLLSQDEQIVRAVSLAMGITAWFVILPLGLASFATGLVQALGTAWGLLRHYWILCKLLLTAVATIVLLLKLGPISYLAEEAAKASFSSADLIGLRTSVMVHAGGGLLVLLTAATLAVYKPQGMTPYGMRKQRELSSAGEVCGPASAVSTPRWVRVFGIVLAILILMLGAMSLLGGHGPGAHIPSDG